MSRSAEPPAVSGRARTLLLVGVYATLLICVAPQHELWRDEAHPWLLVRSADSLTDVLVQPWTDGHPPFWYVALYALAGVAHTPLLLPALTILGATLAVLVFAVAAPFSRRQKWLFALGFFPLYQYGAVYRPYPFLVLLLFAYCALRPSLRRRPVATGIIVAALPLVHAFGVMIAAAILTMEIATRWKEDRRTYAGRDVAVVALATSVTVGSALALVIANPGLTAFPARLKDLLAAVGGGFFPQFAATGSSATVAVGIVLWGISWSCLLRRPRALFLYATWTVSTLGFFWMVYAGQRWHYGLLFMYFVAALWIGRQESPTRPPAAAAYVTVLFALHAGVGVYALAYDMAQPISGSLATARYIRRESLTGLPILGVRPWRRADGSREVSFDIDRVQSTLAYLDGARVYDPELGHFESYWRHYADREHFPRVPEAELLATLSDVADTLGSDLLVVWLGKAPAASPRPHPRLQLLVESPAAARYGESILLYRYLRPRSIPSSIRPARASQQEDRHGALDGS